MDNLILSVIGMEGQRLAGIKVGELVGKQVCESIRSSFKTDIIEKYKELSTEATKNALADPEGMKKLTDALSKTFEGMVIDKFELKSNDPNISGETNLKKVEDKVNETIEAVKTDVKNKIHGVVGTTDKPDMTPNPVTTKLGGVGPLGVDIPEVGPEVPGLPIPKVTDLPIPGAPDPTSALTGAVPNIPPINLDNPLDAIPGAGFIKSAVQGLTPDEGVVPGYLSSALSAIDMKTKMIEGFEQFMNELTTNNSNDLKKVFLEVLKEQINAKFKEGGEFQKTIIDIIQKKCNAKFDPNPVAEAGADAGVQEEPKKNPNPTDIIKSLNETSTSKPKKPNADTQPLETKEDVSQPVVPAEETKGGKSNKPPKRFTRKILK